MTKSRNIAGSFVTMLILAVFLHFYTRTTGFWGFHVVDVIDVLATLAVGWYIAEHLQRKATQSTRLFDLIAAKIAVYGDSIERASRSSCAYARTRSSALRVVMQSDLKKLSSDINSLHGLFVSKNLTSQSRRSIDTIKTVAAIRQLMESENWPPEGPPTDQINRAFSWLREDMEKLTADCVDL